MAKFLSLFLKILVTIPVIAFLFFLTISNRSQSLKITWSPVNDAVDISLPILLFSALVAGFVWGSLILWSNTLEMRAERRVLKKKISDLEKQISVQSKEIERLAAQKSVIPPVSYAPAPVPRIASPEIL